MSENYKSYYKNEEGKLISIFEDDNNKGVVIPKNGTAPYIPSDQIIEIVKLAQVLKRPILIKGEPGCGKTQLAKSIAIEWYAGKTAATWKDYKNHFFEWHIKSTTKISDGIYELDHVRRLYDARSENEEGVDNMERYLNKGPLANALEKSTKDKPSVVLIDEIDKADIDFPNDLLLELDENRFKVPTIKDGEFIYEFIEAEYPPLILITSNDERELPNAFLRRCLFLWLDFPKNEILKKIIAAHLPDLSNSHSKFIEEAIDKFNYIRKKIETEPTENKNVSTGELLSWLKSFEWLAQSNDKYKGNTKQLIEDIFIRDEKGKPLNYRFYATLFKTYVSHVKKLDWMED